MVELSVYTIGQSIGHAIGSAIIALSLTLVGVACLFWVPPLIAAIFGLDAGTMFKSFTVLVYILSFVGIWCEIRGPKIVIV